MMGSIFSETLRREWRGTLFWAIGLAVYAIITAMILPNAEGMAQMTGVLEGMPPLIWQLLGVEDITVIASPAGFFAVRFFMAVAVLLAVWSVLGGLSVTVSDEVRGISNVLLSLPIPRWRVIIEKLAAYAVLAVPVALGGHLGLVMGMQLNPNAQTDAGVLFQVTLAMLPMMLLILALTALVGSILPNRAAVGGIAGLFVAVSFVLKSVAGIAKSDFGDFMAQLSIFQHIDALGVIRGGLAPLPTLVMLGIAAVMTAAAVAFYQRRDIAL